MNGYQDEDSEVLSDDYAFDLDYMPASPRTAVTSEPIENNSDVEEEMSVRRSVRLPVVSRGTSRGHGRVGRPPRTVSDVVVSASSRRDRPYGRVSRGRGRPRSSGRH